MPLTLVGLWVVWRGAGGHLGRKQDNPAIVLSYAALEGLFLRHLVRLG